jgi:hypothetical protein
MMIYVPLLLVLARSESGAEEMFNPRSHLGRKRGICDALASPGKETQRCSGTGQRHLERGTTTPLTSPARYPPLGKHLRPANCVAHKKCKKQCPCGRASYRLFAWPRQYTDNKKTRLLTLFKPPFIEKPLFRVYHTFPDIPKLSSTMQWFPIFSRRSVDNPRDACHTTQEAEM